MAAHELGHTLGMYHASTEDDEYGDHSDPMGGGITAPLCQVNAPHLWQKGWVGILDAVPGIYEIEPTETTEYVLRIGTYYISLRKPVGIDANLQGYVNPRSGHEYLDRVTIHWFDETVAPRRTRLEALLLAGEQFIGSDFTVTVLAIGDTATVQVE